MTSLRLRLLAWLLPVIFVVAAGASVGSLWSAAYSLAQLLDEQLRYVAEHIRTEGDRVSVDRSNEIRRQLGDDHADEVVTEVWRGGRRTYTSDPAVNLPPPQETGLHDVVVGSKVWHAFVVQQGERSVQVAQSKDARWEALFRIAINLAWPIAALLPMLAVCLWFGIGYGLRPLHQVAIELRQRDARSLEPVRPRPLPEEVEPLVVALNDMLRRLERAFAEQGEFIADASHELRTPTMALSVQLELARQAGSPEEREAALDRVKVGVDRIERLAGQLLALARIGHVAPMAPSDRVVLGSICRAVILDQLCAADAKGQALSLEVDPATEVRGDAAMLQVLVRNLVDNAIRYSPPGSRVDVEVRRATDGVVLVVQDNGPGIAPEDRPRVFDRFYRGAGQVEVGSGLGLAIVKRIAQAHGARLSLSEAAEHTGLRVNVRFPDPATADTRPVPAE